MMGQRGYRAGDTVRFRPAWEPAEREPTAVRRDRRVDGTVIYVHPLGRFIVAEYRVRGALSGGALLRETLLTPEHDRRGHLPQRERIAAPTAKAAAQPARTGPNERNRKALTETELREMERLFSTGMATGKIAETLHRAPETVRRHLEKAGIWSRRRKTAR